MATPNKPGIARYPFHMGPEPKHVNGQRTLNAFSLLSNPSTFNDGRTNLFRQAWSTRRESLRLGRPRPDFNPSAPIDRYQVPRRLKPGVEQFQILIVTDVK